jgi:hypothetical protein
MPEVTIKPVWRMEDPKIRQDVIAFWKKHKILPDRIATARVGELAAVAYDGNEVVGVASATTQTMPLLPQKFLLFRCAVAPTHRHRRRDPGLGLAADLMIFCRDHLESWSKAHPEEGVMGMLTVLEGYKARRNLEPYWPEVEAIFIGYTDRGHQIRLTWFQHARV